MFKFIQRCAVHTYKYRNICNMYLAISSRHKKFASNQLNSVNICSSSDRNANEFINNNNYPYKMLNISNEIYYSHVKLCAFPLYAYIYTYIKRYINSHFHIIFIDRICFLFFVFHND